MLFRVYALAGPAITSARSGCQLEFVGSLLKSPKSGVYRRDETVEIYDFTSLTFVSPAASRSVITSTLFAMETSYSESPD